MLTPKHSRVISDLGIFPRSISKVGDHFIGHNNRAAFVWHKGEITEIVPGDSIRHESVSADAVERISGLNFAGTRDDNQTVFMSSSSSFHVELVPEKSESICYDMTTAIEAAKAYAHSAQQVFDVLKISSESATPKYVKYVGKKLAVDDASDDYDLEIEKNDFIKMTYLNKDRYDLRLKDSPRIQFIIRGHAVAQRIIEGMEFATPFAGVSDVKTDTYAYVGTAKKRITAFGIAKDSVILLRRKKHYLAQNLAVPLESWMNSTEIQTLLSNLKVDPEGQSYVKGKVLRSSPKVAPIGKAEKLPKLENPTKVTGSGSPRNIKTVYGAFFAVSPSQPQRSRIVFADSPQKLETVVRGIIDAYTTPVDYKLFTALTTDENYKAASKNRVVIKSTPILNSTYNVSQTVKMQQRVTMPEYVEPRNGAPALEFPVYEGQESKVLDYFRRLIEEGYFSTGIRLAHPQTSTGIRFSAPQITPEIYDQIVGIARRITAYLIHQGVPLKKGNVRIARGSRAAEIRFDLPSVTADQEVSINLLLQDAPTMNAPIYETTKPKQPTVEIIATDIHTGKVTARAQRGPSLYGAPFDTLYMNVKRKIF